MLKETKKQDNRDDKAGGGLQLDLFGDFNGLPDEARSTEFYQHDANWTNRMILGDSLQVMASLAEREGLRGKVQCIYIDPPYGIKFNSNFQWSTTSRDVKDGKSDHITREPEQVKAFRDTWRDGIHSYLTYLRDRLTVARDLLSESGSIFVQIGDENVHRVRALLDEVFGDEHCITEILVKKKGSQKGGTLDAVNDFILWYGKSEKASGHVKFRPAYDVREDAELFEDFPFVELPSGERLRLTELESRDGESYSTGSKALKSRYPTAKLFASNPLKSGGHRRQQSLDFHFQGRVFPIKAGQCWKHTVVQDDGSTPGMERLAMANRLLPQRTDVRFIRHTPEPSIREISNWWDGFGGAPNQVYVVQTNERVVERCLLMATDPGDLVIDPTCGSGTTACVAEHLGRRWITADTSRVALALARARVMGAKYRYYLLADSKIGQAKIAELENRTASEASVAGNIRHGFVYRRAFNVTSGSIANNAEIDVIWEQAQEKLEPLRKDLNKALKQKWEEWEIPREAPQGDDGDWSDAAKKLHADWWKIRIQRQQEIDASIAAKAVFENLYDRPYEDKSKVRVAGPFTVESLSPHRILGVNHDDELIDPAKKTASQNVAERKLDYGHGVDDFVSVILENLKTSGVQQSAREDKINFTTLTGWPGEYICAEGQYIEGDLPDDDADGNPTRERGNGDADGNPTRERGNGDADGNPTRERGNGDADGNPTRERGNGDADGNPTRERGNGDADGNPTRERGNGDADGNPTRERGNEQIEKRAGIFIGPEFGTVSRADLVAAAREAGDASFDCLIACAFNFDAHSSEFDKLGKVPVLKARMNADLHMADDLKNTGAGNLFVIFGEPDIDLIEVDGRFGDRIQVKINGVDVFKPNTGEVISDSTDGIACWFIDTDYNEESFFVRHAYFLGAGDPYKSLKTTLKAEINQEAWESLNSDISRPFLKPKSGRIAVKVINHLGDEVMKVFRVD